MPTPDNNKISNSKTITLLPENYRNEMFEQNLEYLKGHQSELYNAVLTHKCQEYRLCSNQDGSPNILYMPDQTLIYNASSINEILAPIHKKIQNLACNSQLPANYLKGADERWQRNNPIQVAMMDNLFEIGIFNELKLTALELDSLQGYSTDYLPFIRVYGIGLGYHLTELLKQKKISFITIYEPHLDLFYTSLYTIPWQLIFKYFEGKGKGINLVVAATADNLINRGLAFIHQKLVPLTSCFYRFSHFNNTTFINEIIEKEDQTDEFQRHQSDSGWYEDQRIGFYFSARNIQKNNKVFSGKKTKRYFRAFIIGSGPSLNDTIDYIKEYQDDAIIICCGSAITPLLNAGIIPDYQVIQERTWHREKIEERHDLNLMKKISLLKLNVVSPKIDKHFKEILVFQKFKDPGSILLGNNYAVTMAVNPTVTNAGISMAAELGVNEAYLFGVDYGAPIHGKNMHASNTIYDVKSIDDSVVEQVCPDLPGNLGAVIRTTIALSWSHRTTEQRIALHPDVQWFNVGEGALISGTVPVAFENLPTKFPQKIQKIQLRDEISSCFNNQYSPDKILKRLKTEQMEQIEQYFHALLGFMDSVPQTREEIINTLSLLYKAVDIGNNQTHFLPTSLLSFGFKQFINNIYIQTAMEKDDASATHFFEKAKVILIQYIDDIRKDLANIMESLESEKEIEFYT